MKTWNIGNTTVRNPERLRPLLEVFVSKMQGRPFGSREQHEYLIHLIQAGLIKSERGLDDTVELTKVTDGSRKPASAFKQLGFVTDWSDGKPWTVTKVGQALIDHPNIEETTFLRQLLKYQIYSPLESGKKEFHLRPFRVMLRLLIRAHEEGLVGLTKFEIGRYVIGIKTENEDELDAAFEGIRAFRSEYNLAKGSVKKRDFAGRSMVGLAAQMGLKPGTFKDYADSNTRYALMSGLLSLRGSKVAVSEARFPLIRQLVEDDPGWVEDDDYLGHFYDPEWPKLPGDNPAFLSTEILSLRRQLIELGLELGEPYDLPDAPAGMPLVALQAYEVHLWAEIKRLREIQFYHQQKTPKALAEIEDLLEDIEAGTLVNDAYAPAFFEWAIWRLLLAVGGLTGPVYKTRGFKIDDDIRPVHHAQGGAADLLFTYPDFKLVAEMTLMSGSRQFAGEGEPVTRHVFRVVEDSGKMPVYGLFISKKLDPNTADAFHNARYWKTWSKSVQTPVVAIQIEHVLAMVQRMQKQPVTIAELRGIIETMLAMQSAHETGPEWFSAYITHFKDWVGGAMPPAVPTLEFDFIPAEDFN